MVGAEAVAIRPLKVAIPVPAAEAWVSGEPLNVHVPVALEPDTVTLKLPVCALPY